MSTSTLRSRYVGDSVATASPARLVTMLYDRLVRDLTQAETALAAADLETANDRLNHAQDIVLELRAGLRPEAWAGGPGLAALYAYLVRELVGANVAKDAERVAACRTLVEPLAEAWHRAAEAVSGRAAGAVSGRAAEAVSSRAAEAVSGR